MHSSLSRVATAIVVGLLVAACGSAASPALSTMPQPSATATIATSPAATTPPSASVPAATSSASPSVPSIVALAAGDTHTCALTSGGGVRCWGSDDLGQLGNGSPLPNSETAIPTQPIVRPIGRPVDVSGLVSGVTAISAGGKHTCALTGGGGVKCWGWNLLGELGNGSNTDSHVPVDVDGLGSGVTAIAASGSGTCALMSSGRVKCWGMGNWGQLGNAANTDSSVPVDVAGLEGSVSAIAAGGWHTCALTQGAGVMCWGTDAYWPDCGESPCPDERDDTAVAVTGLPSAVRAIAAGGHHTCAVSSAGGVVCWGGASWNGGWVNGSGNELGTPGDVVGLASGVIAISAGGQHTCALISGGRVKCWGINDSGVLGDGTTTWSNSPVDVAGLASGVIAISAGGQHTCALTNGGGVKCWGSNWSGQLGGGSAGEGSLVPIDVDFAIQ